MKCTPHRYNKWTVLLLLALLTMPMQAQQNQTDTPRSGEGIAAFLKRNKRSSKAQYNEFLKLNEKKLKGKKELQLGVKYI